MALYNEHSAAQEKQNNIAKENYLYHNSNRQYDWLEYPEP